MQLCCLTSACQPTIAATMGSKHGHLHAGTGRPAPDSGPGLTALVVFCLFLAIVALLGGSSRPDPTQIIALRPLAALLLVPVLYAISRDAIRPGRAPLALLLSLAVLMVLQVIPLPPSIWHSLPGRGPVVALDQALGQADTWRPLSLVPGRTLNALASLIVPVTACLMVLAYRLERVTLLWAVFTLGVVNGLIGLLQVSGMDFLYVYDFASVGSASGLLANRNHGATLAVVTMLTGVYLAIEAREDGGRGLRRAILLGGVAIVLLSALLSGSRAGLAALIAAMVLSGAMALSAGSALAGSGRGSRRASRTAASTGSAPGLGAGLVIGAAVLSLAAIVALFALFDSIPALDRLAARSLGDEMRLGLLPVVNEMLRTYTWAGAGFGSFEEVYHIHEPITMMTPQYVNQAHNDLAQFVIEGGAPGLLIALVGMFWAARRSIRTLGTQGWATGALYWFGVVLVLVAASAVDYPLRTPLMQVVGVFLILAFAANRSTLPDSPTR